MPVGITTYIKARLCHGTEFTRPVSQKRSGLKNSRAGLTLGRAVDRAFSARVRGSRVTVHQSRIAAIFKALRAAKVTVTGTQTPAAAHGISTRADGGGLFAGTGGAIARKCPTASLATHRDLYHVACRACPTMQAGGQSEPNTEFVRHQLQVGFAANALGWAHGIVVVSCTDGVALYWLKPCYAAARWFTLSGATTAATNKRVRCPAIVWPGSTAPVKTVRIDGKVAVLKGGGSAAAVRKRPSTLRKAEQRALAALFASYPAPHTLLYPHGNQWRTSKVRWLGVK
jgi:hypothetical protein